MSKRMRWLLGLTLLAVAGTAVFAYLLHPRSAINRENFEKIREGMTLAEVEAILGGPARLEEHGPWHCCERGRIHGASIAEGELFTFPSLNNSHLIAFSDTDFVKNVWASSDAIVSLSFGDHGTVVEKDCLTVEPFEDSYLWRVRYRFRLWLRGETDVTLVIWGG